MNDPKQLDDVIFRFHQEVEVPTPEIVSAWTREHPEFAAEIRAHAVEMVDMEFWAGLDDAQSAGAGALTVAAAVDGETLRDAAASAGFTLPELAKQLDIARSLVADVSTGRIIASTVSIRFVRYVATCLGRSVDEIAARIMSPAGPAPVASFKASGGPTEGRAATWEEAVMSSGMSDERKAFWLSEDE